MSNMVTSRSDQYIGVVDFIVFGLMLAISSVIGFFYAYKDRNENSMDNYHRGERKVNPLAVSVSLSVTIISSVATIGIATEVYTYGTMIIWEVVGMFIATGIAAHVFLPIFYNMDKISVFEYFQVRFGRVPRLLSSVCFFINTFILIGFTLYTPCLAFEAMTGVSYWIAMVITASVCMLYTLLGGLKAVVWADTLQFFIIIAGLICTVVQGSNAVGSFGAVWEIANKHERIELANISFDPRTRHSVWTLVIGTMINWSNAFGANQATVQRSCSLSSLRTAQLSQWASFPGLFLIILLSALNGVVMFAYYHTCDPVTVGRIVKNDQLFPLLIVDLLGGLSGLPGLLLAALFSGSLSCISSGLNAISAVFVEDFIVPNTRKPLSDRAQLIISKIAVVGISVIMFGLAGLISTLEGLIHQLINTAAGLFGGPLLGFFIAGMMFPWTNTKGVCVGLVVALGFSGWLIFGSLSTLSPQTPLPVSTDGCISYINMSMNLNLTGTTLAATTVTSTEIEKDASTTYSAVEQFYRMSYLWYQGFGMAIFVIIALVVSFVTGPTNPKNVNSKLIFPLFYNLCPCLPEKFRKVLLFHVDYSKKDAKNFKAKQVETACNENGVITEEAINKQSSTLVTHL